MVFILVVVGLQMDKISILAIQKESQKIQYWKAKNKDWHELDECYTVVEEIQRQIAKGEFESVNSIELQKPSIRMEIYTNDTDIVVFEEYKEKDWSSFATFRNHPDIMEFVKKHPHILCTIQQHMNECYTHVLHVHVVPSIGELINNYLFESLFDYFYDATNRSPEEFYPNVNGLIEVLTVFQSQPESDCFLQFLTKDECDCLQPKNWSHQTMWSWWLQKMDYLFRQIVWKY
jgi:hypothetical protein